MSQLSMDLRRRIIAAHEAGDSVREIAERFAVGASTVQRLVQRHREAGTVEPRPHGGGRARVIDLAGRELLRRLVWQHPNLDWEMLTRLYNELRGTSVSSSTVRHHVEALGLARGAGRSAGPGGSRSA
jgi:transposase